MTDRYCVVGRDVSRSPSPAMMNAAFRARLIDAEYSQLSVPEQAFPKELRRLQSSRFKGFNVTIPFKSRVIRLISGLDAVATRIQAVNTVKREEDGAYVGHNTDPDGISEPLLAALRGLDVRNALLIGAGGAARAFCEAMNRLGILDIGVAVRDLERGQGFVTEMERAFPRLNLTLAEMSDLHHIGHDLVFNASPMGSDRAPLPKELKRSLPGTKLAFDAVYLPRETKLLAEARKGGSRTLHGDEMLLHQGMAAFELWTGEEAPEEEMRSALRLALGEKAGRASGRRTK